MGRRPRPGCGVSVARNPRSVNAGGARRAVRAPELRQVPGARGPSAHRWVCPHHRAQRALAAGAQRGRGDSAQRRPPRPWPGQAQRAAFVASRAGCALAHGDSRQGQEKRDTDAAAPPGKARAGAGQGPSAARRSRLAAEAPRPERRNPEIQERRPFRSFHVFSRYLHSQHCGAAAGSTSPAVGAPPRQAALHPGTSYCTPPSNRESALKCREPLPRQQHRWGERGPSTGPWRRSAEQGGRQPGQPAPWPGGHSSVWRGRPEGPV